MKGQPMARVRFSQDFDYRPTGGKTIEYKAGMELTVRRECADEAISRGKAVEVKTHSRTSSNAES